jgi:RimJ/RimL family protein N-acetyltransferase
MRPRHWAAAWCFCAGRLDRLVLDPAFRRIEATALCAQQPACRFLERLGFRFEAIMRAYGPDGRDHALYARVSAAGQPGDARRAPALAGGEAVYG